MTPPVNTAPIRLGVDGRVLDDRYHGIGRITYELLDRLTGVDGIELTLFLRNTPESDRLDIDALTSRPGVRVVRFDDPLTSVTQFLRWPRVLRRSGVDAMLFPYHLGASLFGARRRYSIVHDCILEADKRFAPDARTRLLYIALTTLVVRRTTVLTPSRASAAAVRDFYKVRVPDAHVVEWGVGTTFAARGAAHVRSGTSHVKGVPLPDRYYLHVGARRPHKNVAQLVRALAGLPPQAHLVLVGSADARWPDNTMDVARELGVAGPGDHPVRGQRGRSRHAVPPGPRISLPVTDRGLRPAAARGDVRRGAGGGQRHPRLPRSRRGGSGFRAPPTTPRPGSRPSERSRTPLGERP